MKLKPIYLSTALLVLLGLYFGPDLKEGIFRGYKFQNK